MPRRWRCVAWGLDNNLTALIDGITPIGSTFWKGLVAGITNLSLGLVSNPNAPGTAWLWALAIGGVCGVPIPAVRFAPGHGTHSQSRAGAESAPPARQRSNCPA